MFLTETLDNNLNQIVTKLNELMNSFWKYAIAALALIIVVWGVYVGIKIIIANKNDEKTDRYCGCVASHAFSRCL